jgi:hypothetical protein
VCQVVIISLAITSFYYLATWAAAALVFGPGIEDDVLINLRYG